MIFLDVRTDFAFKKVFGSEDSKPRLISFLNSLIDFDKHGKITDLDIIDPYNIPQLKGMKDTFVDVKAVLEDNAKIIIEMQVLNHEGFENRVLYNTAKNYSTQLVKGEQYHLLKPVIALTIVDFDMFPDNDALINYFKVLNKKDFSLYNHDIELIFVELNKFTKALEECKNDQDNWLYFLKNAGELEFMPKNLPKTIETAYETTRTANMKPEELELQYKKQEFIAVSKLSISLASKIGMAKGLEQGLEQGIEQGRQEEKLTLAKAMKLQGVDIITISKVTQLNEQEITLL
ncbi:MAG: Rpn family recombination-promoting nuclease/putative transposase [Colwellia sp.]|nr:Rpn family recombination-promoting nuclease/putative transposase [Colwellia sp.]